jgi:hypothetical protein
VVTADTRPIVYLDETCPSHSGKDYNGLKVPDGKGGRVTILHAAYAGGWVYIYVHGEVNSGDYHNKMTLYVAVHKRFTSRQSTQYRDSVGQSKDGTKSN